MLIRHNIGTCSNDAENGADTDSIFFAVLIGGILTVLLSICVSQLGGNIIQVKSIFNLYFVRGILCFRKC